MQPELIVGAVGAGLCIVGAWKEYKQRKREARLLANIRAKYTEPHPRYTRGNRRGG